MVNYSVTVYTSNRFSATTMNNVFIKLVGTNGETERKWLVNLKGPAAFFKGATATFTVSCRTSIGKLVLVEVDKEPLPLFREDSWFPAKIEVKSPEGDVYSFPIYCWITDCEVHRFREGKALRVFEDNHPLGRYSRELELQQRKEDYCWDVYMEGLPHIMMSDDPFSLPCEIRFSFRKRTEIAFTTATGLIELNLKGLAENKKSWTNLNEIDRAFCFRESEISEYVQDHWKEDSFFGYQYLNGINPIMIQRCTALPKNFPVTDEMVFPHGQTCLDDEMKKGNIFLCDYKRFDGAETNFINGKKQYLTAPLVLFHETPEEKLIPIAIQLKQKPRKDNPIFLPTDSEYDWLLAKIYVRNVDFNEHQINVHLLRTHLLAEVFTVSLLRNIPMVHPIYKLLSAHTRYTLQINIQARTFILSDEGFFSKHSSCSEEGVITVLRKSLSSITYSSLCIPDDIAERGIESIPNYYYRDDGLRLWDIMYRFVTGIIHYYYKNDQEVEQDSELQKWILDIFQHGFLSQAGSGIPQKCTTKSELIKYVTMVMYTVSAQHAAVNAGQYDYSGWMPNAPSTVNLPPPTEKGKSSEEIMLKTLPAVNTTVNTMALLWQLSRRSSDFVPLGHYPEDHFREETPCNLIWEFQRDLEILSTAIKARNKHLEVPYTYLDPEGIENSVAI